MFKSWYEYPPIMPKPHDIEYYSSTLLLKKVLIECHFSISDDIFNYLIKNILQPRDIEVVTEYDADATTIHLNHTSIMEIAHSYMQKLKPLEQLGKEGYRLVVDSKSNHVWLDGKDEMGLLHALRSFDQLFCFPQGSTVCDVVITDAPEIPLRGIVEGFYGTPWSHQERLDQLSFYGKYKMNAYIYAPKDDLYHRKQWRESYPDVEFERMQELVRRAKEERIEFIFAISPGIDVRFDGDDGERDFEALLFKMENVYQLGVRSFAIFFDDIENRSGAKQAHFLNRFKNEFIEKKSDINLFMTVPVEYDTSVMFDKEGQLREYTQSFASNLNKDILVLWTGKSVVPPYLDSANIDIVRSIYKNPLGLWWNYPVSDYYKDKLALGPIYNVTRDLNKEVKALFINPMEHADLSKISILTSADYAWNSSDYDDDSSFKDALKVLYSDLAPAMLTFASHSSHMKFTWAECGRFDAPMVKAISNQLLHNYRNKKNYSYEYQFLVTIFGDMIESSNILLKSLSQNDLKHCESHLQKLKLLGNCGLDALNLLKAFENTDDASFADYRERLSMNIKELKSGKRLSELVIESFIDEIVELTSTFK